MLAKEIVEDSILPFLTHEPLDVDMDGESTSHKVDISEPLMWPLPFQGLSHNFLLLWVGSLKNKT
jgi:hypothetical protein